MLNNWTLPKFKVNPKTKVEEKIPNFKLNTLTESVVSKYEHNDAADYVSDILYNLINNEFFYDDAYHAFDNTVNDEEVRLNLIDNGYSKIVCRYVSNMTEDSEFASQVNYLKMCVDSEICHYFIEIGNKFYDAYNYNGVDQLNKLEFVNMYIGNAPDAVLKNKTTFISTGYFEEK